MKTNRKKKNRENGIKKKFQIPQIPKVVGLRTDYGFKSTEFISPLFGDDVKDGAVLPFVVKVIGDKDKKYDAFRVEKRLDDETATKRYGKKYFEFTNFVNKNVREKSFGVRSYHERVSDIIVDDNNLATNLPFEKPIDIPVDSSIDRNHLEQNNNNNNNNNFINQEENNNYNEDVSLYEQKIEPKMEFAIETHEVEEFVDQNGLKVKIKTGFGTSPDTNPVNDHDTDHDFNLDTYRFPSTDMFHRDPRDRSIQPQWLIDQTNIINQTLRNHSVEGEVSTSKKGPSVSRHEISLLPGVNVNRVSQIKNNIMMNLSANSLRIEAPVPGKPYVGIEVPNEDVDIIYFGDLIDNPEFYDKNHPLKVVLGEDIDGDSIYANVEDMPHALIAGATNSGKSVSLHVILMSLLLKNSPDTLKLLLIDPKMVELSSYSDIPHLITPVITDAKDATKALYWAVEEVEDRYRKFQKTRVRNIKEFNKSENRGNHDYDKMPFIVIVIDELADLMDVAEKEVEGYIKRLTQKARAAGVHLIIATQRPTTEIISGSIKANITTRIAFKMPAAVDSVTILDGQGAEQLLGRGDMLFKNLDTIIRLQGAYISNDEIYTYTDLLRSQYRPRYELQTSELKQIISAVEEEDKEIIKSAAFFVERQGSASMNAIQSEFNVGFSRASKIIDKLEQLGIVSSSAGTQARKVLMSRKQLENIFYNDGDW